MIKFECVHCYFIYSMDELKETWDVEPSETTCSNERIKVCPNCGNAKFFINVINNDRKTGVSCG